MRHTRIERGLAIVGACALLIVGFDAATYGATGNSLILGAVNQAGQTTRIQSAVNGSTLMVQKSGGIGAPLGLTVPPTRAAATPPIATNARGRVANLYADRAATADNAAKVGGLTASQLTASARTSSSTVFVTSISGAPAHTTEFAFAECPAGKVATGGGFSDGYDGDVVVASFPNNNGDPGVHPPTNWEVGINNTTGTAHEFVVYVVCGA